MEAFDRFKSAFDKRHKALRMNRADFNNAILFPAVLPAKPEILLPKVKTPEEVKPPEPKPKKLKPVKPKVHKKKTGVFWIRPTQPVQVDHKTFDDYLGFINGLKKRGFKSLGQGYFSYVLGKEGSDRVIKVSIPHHRSGYNEGWLPYVLWGHAHGYAGSLTPKVYSCKWIKPRKGEKFFVAVMERLHQTIRDTPEHHPFKIVSYLLDFNKMYSNPTAFKLLDTVHPGLSDFFSQVQSAFKGSTLDIHNENLMVRKDGSLVANDLIARCDITTEEKRLRARDFESLAIH